MMPLDPWEQLVRDFNNVPGLFDLVTTPVKLASEYDMHHPHEFMDNLCPKLKQFGILLIRPKTHTPLLPVFDISQKVRL